uniref:Protein kinase domain-containing protein n=1 Tax=Plectus sambesii TaxID=2011161 RepID=A0A914VL63_9BILA
VIANKGHNKAVDWWALGVLIYEMHAGFPPFQGANALEIYDRILEGKLKFPKTFNLFAKDLCRKLLQTDRTQRIGGMKVCRRDFMTNRSERHHSNANASSTAGSPPFFLILWTLTLGIY